MCVGVLSRSNVLDYRFPSLFFYSHIVIGIILFILAHVFRISHIFELHSHIRIFWREFCIYRSNASHIAAVVSTSIYIKHMTPCKYIFESDLEKIGYLSYRSVDTSSVKLHATSIEASDERRDREKEGWQQDARMRKRGAKHFFKAQNSVGISFSIHLCFVVSVHIICSCLFLFD